MEINIEARENLIESAKKYRLASKRYLVYLIPRDKVNTVSSKLLMPETTEANQCKFGLIVAGPSTTYVKGDVVVLPPHLTTGYDITLNKVSMKIVHEDEILAKIEDE